MSTRFHLAQSVRGALANWTPAQWRNATKWITRDDGSKMTAAELKSAFLDLLAAGNEVIPIGDTCNDFDPKKGCRGHEMAAEVVT